MLGFARFEERRKLFERRQPPIHESAGLRRVQLIRAAKRLTPRYRLFQADGLPHQLRRVIKNHGGALRDADGVIVPQIAGQRGRQAAF